MAELFIRFCARKFKLVLMAARISETREKPKIPMATIVLLMVMGLALGRRSLHQIDHLARRRSLRRSLGSERDMVASDTTLQRVIPTIALKEVREELQKNYIVAKQGGTKFTLASGRRIRVGVIDGYETGSGMASCLRILADRGSSFIDAEPYAKEGKELPSSTALIERVVQRHGKEAVDIILGDPLYISASLWKKCRDQRIHVLVKGDASKKEDLLVLREARELASDPNSVHVERVEGVDPGRGVSYRVRAVRGLTHDGYPGTVKVALVEETRIKPRRGKQANRPNVSAFWVIATDETLTPLEMRELGHLRWSIENQGFRTLNAHLGSKGTWTRGDEKSEMFAVLLFLMLLAFNLASAFRESVDTSDVRKDLDQSSAASVHAITLRLLADRILETLHDAEPLVSEP
ncbi:MAG: hypothetical protein HY720_25510 [Planctomycetes bacterium]|nr:hypothetical protein [Planctomycetota bacterium]